MTLCCKKKLLKFSSQNIIVHIKNAVKMRMAAEEVKHGTMEGKYHH